jgi:hypothetical protein
MSVEDADQDFVSLCVGIEKRQNAAAKRPRIPPIAER